MRIGRVVGAVVVGLLLAACTLPVGNPTGDDADLVLVLPALDQNTFVQEQQLLQPFLAQLNLSHTFVPLSDIVAANHGAPLTAESVRQYLRGRFTWRFSTAQRPRYLGIVAAPTADYTGAPMQVPTIPRFLLHAAAPFDQTFDTDLPYEFLAPATIDGGDGTVDPNDLNLSFPTFDVFRIPISQPADLTTFADRHAAFAAASYRSDATLLAGSVQTNGDTSAIQCLNANALQQPNLATHVFKIFDSTTCSPDVMTTPSGPSAASVLAASNSAFHGGLVVDVSHGSPSAIFANNGSSTNLDVTGAATIPSNRLNIFVSIACDNDGARVGARNLAAAMYEQSSVAVVSATTTVTPVSPDSVLAAEVDSVVGLYQHPENLLQRLHAFRTDYYTRFVRTTTGGVQTLHWINLLTVNLVGDGFVSVAR
jgi:hypothetical protein